MIISHKHKFIFIKTRKVGGTSLEIAISKYLGSGDIVTPADPEDEELRRSKGFVSSQNYKIPLREFGPKEIYIVGKDIYKAGRKRLLHISKPSAKWPTKYYNHIPAKLVRNLIGEKIWESYFKFSIERNPWDLAVSMYFFKNRNNKKTNFKNFIREGKAYIASNFDLYSIDGIPALDRIIKYETLDSELPEISRDIGLPENIFEAMKAIRAKGHYRMGEGYKSFYDEETKNLIKVQFAREIALFNYSFE